MLGGHLATVSNFDEHQWIFTTFGDLAGEGRNLYIGLNDSEVEGSFVWASGIESSYTNWRPGEPNNQSDGGDVEDFAIIWNKRIDVSGRWNDVSGIADPINPPSSQYGGTPFGVVEILPGDANSDNVVDLGDFVILRNNFGSSNATFQQGDFNYDGEVDLADFVILRNFFGDQGNAPPLSSIPEPAAASLLLVSVLGLRRRR